MFSACWGIPFVAIWFLDEMFKLERLRNFVMSIITDYIQIPKQNTIFVQSDIESNFIVKFI